VAVKTKNKIDLATKKESELISEWIQPDGLSFVKHQQTVYAWPEELLNDFNWLLQQLKVVYSGTKVGELIRDKLIPDHALATSGRVNASVPRVELSYEKAIQYLQRKELQPDMSGKGWQLVTFGGHPLGWINVLPNRVNNYYPKEMRILKDN
jgi:NOL1/NOP2/fmu family ribosome biogenesis protein